MYLFSYDEEEEGKRSKKNLKKRKTRSRDGPIGFTFNCRATVQLVEKSFSLFEKVNRGKGSDAFSLR